MKWFIRFIYLQPYIHVCGCCFISVKMFECNNVYKPNEVKSGISFILPDSDMIGDSEMFCDILNQLEDYGFRVDMHRTFIGDDNSMNIDTIYKNAHVDFRIDKYRVLHIYSDFVIDYKRDAQLLVLDMIHKQINKVRKRSRNLDMYVHIAKFAILFFGPVSIVILFSIGFSVLFSIFSSITILIAISMLLSLKKLAIYEKSINSMDIYE